MQTLSSLFNKRISFICGAFGSGKTELSLNLAIALAKQNPDVALVDLDIVNLYFRSRQMRALLSENGIETIDSSLKGDLIDMPALSPAIQGAFDREELRVVVDVGGDDVGARVLGRYALRTEDMDFLLVVNTYRPFSDNAEKVSALMRDIEIKSRIKVDGIIVNSNLGDETTPENLLRGAELLQAGSLEVPIRGALYWAGDDEEPDMERRQAFLSIGEKTGIPVIPIRRFMRPFSMA
ncbi:MAG: hypothetical protein CVV64_05795 [Candidatus Wallbacteria bacterium HGW-Wallbacteria-1]|jgi:hypothetical protein|uniref:CobQ/CobB/MinD/ParA nucleotide binding domain-containing protein n=1 Tax=Candidatus Wallbacteria bacterium HGW-Wallbacteria-1 TaxID=2013854 RepID=A0A2N1PSG0_9BACT|nr:MAG: hypothetical protein CVV64_05795 [Candidatus Wallbacteria bacterium HGW-Wallbacteria-1]